MNLIKGNGTHNRNFQIKAEDTTLLFATFLSNKLCTVNDSCLLYMLTSSLREWLILCLRAKLI